MLVKSLVTGTILTLLAGGVVYYGTDVSEAVSVSDTHPHADNKTENFSNSGVVENSSDIPSLKTKSAALIDPKASSITVDIKNADENMANARKSVTEDLPTRKWIDQYLSSKPETSNESFAERETVIAPETEMETVTKEMDIDAKETAKMETEIAEILALEEEIDKEMTAIMVDMEDTDRLDTLDTEAFVNRAKNIDPIWGDESDAKEEHAKTAPHTLNRILKNSDTPAETDTVSENPIEENPIEEEMDAMKEMGSMKEMDATAEAESIDLGNSKMIILKAENVEGHSTQEHSTQEHLTQNYSAQDHSAIDDDTQINDDTQKIRLKVRKNETKINCDEKSLAEPVYKSHDMKKPHGHTAHAKSEHKKMHRMEKGHQRECEDAPRTNSKVEASETVKIIMAQAEKISMPELRDRAYLDLVSYALENGDTASANIATSKIEQVELRDTARNRMAVNYAKNGNAEKAFAILEDIEVDALRDVMRLQVIEALITPETQNSEAMQ